MLNEIFAVLHRHRDFLELFVGHDNCIVVAGAAPTDKFLPMVFVEILFACGQDFCLRI